MWSGGDRVVEQRLEGSAESGHHLVLQLLGAWGHLG